MQSKADKDGDHKPGFEETVPFSALCKYVLLSISFCYVMNKTYWWARLFEKATKAKKHGQKKAILQTFFSHYEDDNYFPVMRLLLPQVCFYLILIL